MPRCFLAKQSNSVSSDKRLWNSNEGKIFESGPQVFKMILIEFLLKDFSSRKGLNIKLFLIHERKVG